MPEADHHEVLEEKHFSPKQLAQCWSVSADTIRRLFRDEVGVLRIRSSSGRKHARPYITIRIPASVAARVYQKHCSATRVLDVSRSNTPMK
jgi:hypothetical protein